MEPRIKDIPKTGLSDSAASIVFERDTFHRRLRYDDNQGRRARRTSIMTRHDSEQRGEQLRDEIERANEAYYLRDAPILTDAEWDARFDELQRLEVEHPDLVTPSSPTQRVGPVATKSSEFGPVTHSLPMLSLAK